MVDEDGNGIDMQDFDDLLRGAHATSGNQDMDMDEGGDDWKGEPGETGPGHDGANTSTEFDWREMNRQRKKKAGLFCCLADLTERLVVLQLFTNLACSVIFLQLQLSSDDWETHQQREVARGRPRRFKVLETAQSKVFSKCIRNAQGLLWEIPWVLGASRFTYFARGFIFRLVSTFLCALESMMGRYHRIHPYAMFKCLLGLESAKEVFAMPHCFRDRLADIFFRKHSSPDASQSNEALCFLQSLAMMTEVDIAAMECGHSSIREYTKQRGRGHTPTLSEVSARVLSKFVYSKHGKVLERRNPQPEQHGEGDGDDDHQDHQENRRVRRTGAGGAYRAFISEHAKGQRLNPDLLRTLTSQYNGLTFDEKQVYKEKGALLTMMKRYERQTGRVLEQKQDEKQISNVDALVSPAVSSQQLLQLDGPKPHNQILTLGNTLDDRCKNFKQILKKERAQQLATYETFISIPEGASLQTNIEEDPTVCPDLVMNFLEVGGPAFCSGLLKTPGVTNPVASMEHFQWKMPIIPLVKDDFFTCQNPWLLFLTLVFQCFTGWNSMNLKRIGIEY